MTSLLQLPLLRDGALVRGQVQVCEGNDFLGQRAVEGRATNMYHLFLIWRQTWLSQLHFRDKGDIVPCTQISLRIGLTISFTFTVCE